MPRYTLRHLTGHSLSGRLLWREREREINLLKHTHTHIYNPKLEENHHLRTQDNTDQRTAHTHTHTQLYMVWIVRTTDTRPLKQAHTHTHTHTLSVLTHCSSGLCSFCRFCVWEFHSKASHTHTHTHAHQTLWCSSVTLCFVFCRMFFFMGTKLDEVFAVWTRSEPVHLSWNMSHALRNNTAEVI